MKVLQILLAALAANSVIAMPVEAGTDIADVTEAGPGRGGSGQHAGSHVGHSAGKSSHSSSGQHHASQPNRGSKGTHQLDDDAEEVVKRQGPGGKGKGKGKGKGGPPGGGGTPPAGPPSGPPAGPPSDPTSP